MAEDDDTDPTEDEDSNQQDGTNPNRPPDDGTNSSSGDGAGGRADAIDTIAADAAAGYTPSGEERAALETADVAEGVGLDPAATIAVAKALLALRDATTDEQREAALVALALGVATGFTVAGDGLTAADVVKAGEGGGSGASAGAGRPASEAKSPPTPVRSTGVSGANSAVNDAAPIAAGGSGTAGAGAKIVLQIPTLQPNDGSVPAAGAAGDAPGGGAVDGTLLDRLVEKYGGGALPPAPDDSPPESFDAPAPAAPASSAPSPALAAALRHAGIAPPPPPQSAPADWRQWVSDLVLAQDSTLHHVSDADADAIRRRSGLRAERLTLGERLLRAAQRGAARGGVGFVRSTIDAGSDFSFAGLPPELVDWMLGRGAPAPPEDAGAAALRVPFVAPIAHLASALDAAGRHDYEASVETGTEVLFPVALGALLGETVGSGVASSEGTAAGEIAGSESFTARSAAGPKFDPIELDAALGRLEQRYGQSVHWMDGESERYLATVGSEAEYMPGLPGEPGTVILPPEPTRAQVIEELMHFEQHEAMGFAELSEQQFVNLEIEAQDRLLDMAAREGWTQAEVDAITEARTYWMGRRR